ncbi:MAG TPA: sugar-binding protein, partial [bacterium]|nr:sugar-binding protein [bacterium]
MKFHKLVLSAAILSLWGLSSFSYAGPSAEISDTASPIQIDGDLSDWTSQPVIVLDQKTNVVLGQNDWTGPDYGSAKIYITYDQKNFYIAADITSKTPQYNAQNASNIYNGDALELYVGTDLSNPARQSYAPTDVQFVVSPGKNGDGAEVYSMTDKGDIPGAKVATKLTAKGYTLEASIPLSYFYKIDVGPGKSIGFDVSMDDVGAMSKTRTLQLSWSGSDKSWQDPSVWGSLKFTGQTTYVNTAPKQAMPGAVVAEMDPAAGKKNASTLGLLVWGFNGDTGGFTGAVSVGTDITSEGTGALVVN